MMFHSIGHTKPTSQKSENRAEKSLTQQFLKKAYSYKLQTSHASVLDGSEDKMVDPHLTPDPGAHTIPEGYHGSEGCAGQLKGDSISVDRAGIYGKNALTRNNK